MLLSIIQTDGAWAVLVLHYIRWLRRKRNERTLIASAQFAFEHWLTNTDTLDTEKIPSVVANDLEVRHRGSEGASGQT